MANKEYKDKAQQRRKNDPRISKGGPFRRQFWWWLVIALIVVGGGLIATKLAVKSNDQTRATQSTVKSDRTPSPEPSSADTAWDPSWPPLPVSGAPARPIEVCAQLMLMLHGGRMFCNTCPVTAVVRSKDTAATTPAS